MNSLPLPRRALAPIALLLLAATPALSTPSAVQASEATAPTPAPVAVSNGYFEQGTAQWRGRPRSSDLTSVTGRTGRGVQVTVPRRGRSIGVTHTVATVSQTQLGDEYDFSAWVRPTTRMRVRLRSVEREGTRTRSRSVSVVVPGRRWTQVTMPFTPAWDTSELRIGVWGVRPPRRAQLRVDNVTATATRPVVTQPADPPPPPPPPAPEECTRLERGLPSCGVYVGSSYQGNGDPGPLEARTSRLGVRRTYFRADQLDYAVRVAQTDLAAGRLPWISFKFPLSWEDMAAGRGDQWVRTVATRLAQLDGPVWVAFHHEPEGDGDIHAWTRAQQHVAPIVRELAPNVAYSIVLMGYHQVFGDVQQYGVDKIWPDTKIDILGLDTYNYYGVDGYRAKAPTDLTARYFVPLGAWAREHGVAWGVAEMGYTNRTLAEDPQWLTRTFEGIEDNGGIAMTYFNSSLNSVTDWRLDTDADFNAFGHVLGMGTRPLG